MTMGPLLVIQTPAGPVTVGDTVVLDLSQDPVARNYGWPKRATGKVVSAHADSLSVAMLDLKAPAHLGGPGSILPPPMGFMFWLREDNAEIVLEVLRP